MSEAMKALLHSGPGLLIGIPTLGRPVPLDWAFAFKSLNPPINYNTMFHIVVGKEVAAARNDMVQAAIDKGAKYLFFMGDDTVPPNHALRQLIYRMEHDDKVGVVGGVYCAKADPAYPLVFRGNGRGSFWDWKIGEYFEVTGLGMDCTLLRIDMLKGMEGPWFKTVKDDRYLDGINSAEEWTEDLYFLNRVVNDGRYKIMCDGSVICSHHDVYGKKIYNLPPDSLPMRQKVKLKDKQGLLIGEPLTMADGDEFEITTFGDEGSDFRGHPSSLPWDADVFHWIVITNILQVTDAIALEAIRVCKPGGKITMHFQEFIDVHRVIEHYRRLDIKAVPTTNCSIIDIFKPVAVETPSGV